MSRRVPLRSQEMQRHVRLRPLDTAVVTRRDVLDLTTLRAGYGADVDGPLPPRLVAGAPDGEIADLHEIELPHLEAARLVGSVESSDVRIVHGESPSGCTTRVAITPRRW